MPNRILKETICTSDTLDELSWFEEVFWYRLIVNCDDFGRFDARPAILKSRLFPLKGTVTEKSICDALNKLSTVGLVILYEYEDKPYLQLATWGKHQQMRATKSKYPAYTSSCNQLISDDIKCPRNRIRNPIEVDSRDGANAPAAPAIISLLLNDKTEYGITGQQLEEWSTLYPAVDVMQELRKMKGWLDANPQKRKTRRGILRFVTGWLAKEQDKPHPHIQREPDISPPVEITPEMDTQRVILEPGEEFDWKELVD